jgi:hypothetical protein
MVDDPVHVVAVDRNSVPCEAVKARRVKNIPLVLQTRDVRIPRSLERDRRRDRP